MRRAPGEHPVQRDTRFCDPHRPTWRDGSHIAIYAGHGQIIESANTKVGTVRRQLWDNPGNVVGIRLQLNDKSNQRTRTVKRQRQATSTHVGAF